MKLLGRTAWMLAGRLRRPRVTPLEETSLTMRVWPTDLDMFLHMNNSRYLAIMDVGRLDAILRSGVFQRIRDRGWSGVVASETIRFRESLAPFARFELRTRVLGWDERSLYYRQTFVRKGRVAAVGLVRIRFLRRDGSGTLQMAEVAEALSPGLRSPPLPEYIRTWQAAEDAFTRDGSARGAEA
jgi:acyl-CoA thioesterase FadM